MFVEPDLKKQFNSSNFSKRFISLSESLKNNKLYKKKSGKKCKGSTSKFQCFHCLNFRQSCSRLTDGPMLNHISLGSGPNPALAAHLVSEALVPIRQVSHGHRLGLRREVAKLALEPVVLLVFGDLVGGTGRDGQVLGAVHDAVAVGALVRVGVTLELVLADELRRAELAHELLLLAVARLDVMLQAELVLALHVAILIRTNKSFTLRRNIVLRVWTKIFVKTCREVPRQAGVVFKVVLELRVALLVLDDRLEVLLQVPQQVLVNKIGFLEVFAAVVTVEVLHLRVVLLEVVPCLF